MTHAAPRTDLPATLLHGRRLPYAQAPTEVRSWVEHRLGGTVDAWRDTVGGMSTGVAAVVRGAHDGPGRSLFVKAIDGADNPRGFQAYAREAGLASRLPDHPAVPALRWSGTVEVASGATWWVSLFAAAPGRIVAHPWTPAALARVLAVWDDLASVLATTQWDEPAALASVFSGWQAIAADASDPWAELAPSFLDRERWLLERMLGTPEDPPVLSHVDLRADNILIAGAEQPEPPTVSFLDWAHPGLAARWMDVALLLGDVVASGADRSAGGPIDVVEVWAAHTVCWSYDPEHLICTLSCLGAMLHVRSRGPLDPRLPHRTAWARAASENLSAFIRGVLRS